MTTWMPSSATGTGAPTQRVPVEQTHASTAVEDDGRPLPVLDVVIPVYNEENDLAPA